VTASNASTARPKPGAELTVNVDRLTYGGDGIARHDGLAVFVTAAAPAEVVRARVRRVFRRHVECDLVSVEKPSPDRVVPRCRHFDQGCGGCTWQHVSYQAQLRAKADSVRDSLERLAGLRRLPIEPIVGAPDAYYYRNKMEFAFHPKGILGLHRRGSWYDILSLEECFLETPLALAIVKAAQTFVREQGMSLYDPRSKQGLLRELCVRRSRATGEILLGLVTSPGELPEQNGLAAHLRAVDPTVVGVVRSIRRSDGPGPGGETHVLSGKDHLTETVAGINFRIYLGTFFQTNSAQAERLVQIVRELAGDVHGQRVVDVYCGVGLFALTFCAAGAQVTGVEIVEAAVESARANAAQNGFSSIVFHAARCWPTCCQPGLLPRCSFSIHRGPGRAARSCAGSPALVPTGSSTSRATRQPWRVIL